MNPTRPLFIPPLNTDTMPASGLELTFEATEAERRQLIQRLDLVALDLFRGHVKVTAWRKKGFMLKGHFNADVVQSCVVTLEPVAARLNEDFTTRFLPVEMLEVETSSGEKEIVIDPDGEDPPEGFEGGMLDIGEALAEQLALALDPYPRKPGASLDPQVEGEGETAESRPNPFAILENFKKKD